MALRRNKRKYIYSHPRPMVTVDLVVLVAERSGRRVLLIRRRHRPFEGRWALPGGFVEMNESLDEAARRELAEETGLVLPNPAARGRRERTRVRMEQLHTFGRPDRDPRGRTITVAYLILIPKGRIPATTAGDDAAETAWFSCRRLPRLAFDHDEIIRCALQRLNKRGRARSPHSS